MVGDTRVSRRQIVGTCLFSMVPWVWPLSTARAGQVTSKVDAEAARLLRAREVSADGVAEPAVLQPSVITLDLNEIAGSDGMVELSITINSRAVSDATVSSVLILAEQNPQPLVKTLYFHAGGSSCGSALTRFHLARSQRVVAVAKMSDGSLQSVGKDVFLRAIS